MVSSLIAAIADATSPVCSPWRLIGLQSVLLLLLQFEDFSSLYTEKKGSVYNVLWVLVFGFATLNILGLVLRRFDPRKSGLNFGEVLAITVVFFSVLLLGLEMLNLFHIVPVKLPAR
jgi:hypothetical protein